VKAAVRERVAAPFAAAVAELTNETECHANI